MSDRIINWSLIVAFIMVSVIIITIRIYKVQKQHDEERKEKYIKIDNTFSASLRKLEELYFDTLQNTHVKTTNAIIYCSNTTIINYRKDLFIYVIDVSGIIVEVRGDTVIVKKNKRIDE